MLAQRLAAGGTFPWALPGPSDLCEGPFLPLGSTGSGHLLGSPALGWGLCPRPCDFRRRQVCHRPIPPPPTPWPPPAPEGQPALARLDVGPWTQRSASPPLCGLRFEDCFSKVGFLNPGCLGSSSPDPRLPRRQVDREVAPVAGLLLGEPVAPQTVRRMRPLETGGHRVPQTLSPAWTRGRRRGLCPDEKRERGKTSPAPQFRFGVLSSKRPRELGILPQEEVQPPLHCRPVRGARSPWRVSKRRERRAPRGPYPHGRRTPLPTRAPVSDSSQGRRLTPRDLFPPLELFLNHQTYIAQEPLGRVGRADARAGPPQDRASPRGNGRSRIDDSSRSV